MQIKKIVLAATTIVIPLLARDCVMLCFPDTDAQIGIEALYWKPCYYLSPYGVVVSETTVDSVAATSLEYLAVSPDYEWGFRLFGSIADPCHCNFASLEWTHVHGTTAVTTFANGRNLRVEPSTNTSYNEIFASTKTAYGKVRIHLGHRFCGTKCSYLYGYLGGRYVDINYRQRNVGRDPVNGLVFVRDVAKFGGGGLEAGIGVTHELSCYFGINARLGALATMGNQSFLIRRVFVPPSSTDNEEEFTNGQVQCVGGYDFRIGIHGTYTCGCCRLRGEVGYEYELYHRALIFRQNDTRLVESDLVESNFAMGGVYLGISATF